MNRRGVVENDGGGKAKKEKNKWHQTHHPVAVDGRANRRTQKEKKRTQKI